MALEFVPSGHPIKLERYREDYHGPCARMTRTNREMVQIFLPVVGDDAPDAITGFLVAGVGNVDLRRKTTLSSIQVAKMFRFLVDSYNKPIPAILEIPSMNLPYDPAQDSVLSRVKYLFSTDSVASDRR